MIEPFPLKASIRKPVRNNNNVVVLFHGSITHYNINFDELTYLLKGLSKFYNVTFVCISNLSEIDKKIDIKNLKVKYFEYEFDLLVDWLNKSTIGYVPSFFPVNNYKLTTFVKNFIFKGHQNNMEIFFEKFSANAGRCYPFAQYGIPFLAHPSREVVADFSNIENFEFPANKQQMLDQALKILANSNLYKNISMDLMKLSREKYSFENIAKKLMTQIENFVFFSSK